MFSFGVIAATVAFIFGTRCRQKFQVEERIWSDNAIWTDPLEVALEETHVETTVRTIMGTLP